MIDLTPAITQAQIAFALSVIAFVLVYIFFVKKPILIKPLKPKRKV